MAEVFQPQQPFMAMSIDHSSIRPEPDALMPRTSTFTPPEPNPSFVFPMQSERPGTSSSHTRAASTLDLSVSRRSMNRSRPQRLSLNHSPANPLPAFDFNPSASSGSATTPESPTRSPTRSRLVPTHSCGHRRNGSEYIGGDNKAGGAGLISTSPTKGEGALPKLQPSRAGPPNSRRGHAHRRSGAVSNHDLSVILKPAGDRKGSYSAPTTPSDPVKQRSFPPDFDRSISQPILASHRPETPTKDQSGTSIDNQSRRVGFSETIEYIPRPLSTISSETSSSLSTARANHSVTGSITSIVSAGTSSPPSALVGRSLLDISPEHDVTRPRPKTAGPVMHGFQEGSMSNRDMGTSKRPSSASAMKDKPIETVAPSALPDWKFPVVSGELPDEPSSESMNSWADAPTSTHTPLEGLIAEQPRRRSINPNNSSSSRPRTSPEPKIAKRQRKVKSWAGSILSRKGRFRDPREKVVNIRSSLSSPDYFAPESEFSLENVNFDEDTTCVIKTPSVEDPKLPRVQTDFSSWQPRERSPSSDSDSIQMLDLDAALGSCSTPILGSSSDDLVAGGFFGARRRMHSSGMTGPYSGQGMQYHRRAESAPEMPAINYHTFGFPRAGSNPAMADVFEEEEEEVEEEEENHKDMDMDNKVQEEPKTMFGGQSKVQEDNGDLGLGVEVVHVDNTHNSPMQRNTVPGFNIDGEGRRRSSTKLEHNIPVRIPDEQSSVEIVAAEEEPRFSLVMKSSDESTITPTLSHDPFISRPVSAPIDFALHKPNLALATPQTYSAVSSPDFTRSSFDVPRLHTAHSSITDRATLSSSRTGDHCVGAQASVEDVPSLTSSASTTMSAQPHRFSGSADTRSSAERSASLSAAVPPRSRPATAYKRSSLASLSRLVGSSYGEKSKLSIEDRVQPDNADKKEKKKGHRISRLMRFWKSKEKLAPS